MNPAFDIAGFVSKLEVLYGGGMVFIFWLIFTFLFFALLFLVMTLLSRFAKDSDAKFVLDLNTYFEDRLLGLLYGVNDKPREQNLVEIKLKQSTRFQKQLLADIMVRLGKGLSGGMADEIQQLYRNLGLDKYSIGKLKAANWSVQASAISELREMQVVEAIPQIRRLLNHRISLVRSNAQLALLELEAENDRLNVFEQINYPLTSWDQLRLYESLKSRNGDKIDSFSRLFGLKNHSIVVFGIRMSANFGCSRDIPLLQELCTHRDAEIRTEAILALTRLGDYLFQEILADQFEVEEIQVQRAILQYLMYTGYDDISFFKHTLLNSDHQVSMQAAKALAQINPEGFPEAYVAAYQSMPEVAIRLLHAADRRLLGA